MSEIKVILLCGSRFAMPVLQELLFFNQLAAVCVPCHCKEMIEDTEALLSGLPIPLLKSERTSFTEDIKEAIEKYAVNLGLVMTFSYKVPAFIYDLPVKGFYNVHPSSLPKYRGADPIFQQIKNKEKYAGVTIHKLDEGIDSGPIVIQESIQLHANDTYGLLTTKLSLQAAGLVRTLVKLASLDIVIPSKKQDTTKASYFSKQTAKDVVIDWEQMRSEDIVALINACNPWNKGAITKMNQKIVRLVQAEKQEDVNKPDIRAGTVLEFYGISVLVSTIGNEAIRLDIISVDEGLFTASALHRFGIQPGNFFETIRDH